MSQLSIQELFANFQVIRILGEGSFAKVFLIRHSETSQQYAMKKYSKYQISKLGKQKSLIRSTRILLALSHQNIIKFKHYVIGEDDQIYLLYQACTKGSLENIKEKISQASIDFIREIIYQLAQALFYLKSVAVAHRDIKPSNISINSQGELKVIDFDEAVCYNEKMLDKEIGLAKKLEFQQETNKIYSRRSRVNSYVGTQLYMCPQMKNVGKVDERGDIWAFGCILYELISSKMIFYEEEEDLLQKKIEGALSNLQQKINLLGKNKTDYENALDLIKKVLQVNPIDRLPISQILEHGFFRDYALNRSAIQRKFRKFLRFNISITKPESLTRALIGMRIGKQKCQYLKDIPVLVKIERQVDRKRMFLDFLKCKNLSKILKKENSLGFPEIYYIVGGAKYFKLKKPEHQKGQLYIYYNQIDGISIVGDSIVIKKSEENELDFSQPPTQVQQIHIKYLTESNDEQVKLFELMVQILKD